MNGKIAIVINSGMDQKEKVLSGIHVAKRIYDARKENNIQSVEVFLFTGGVRSMANLESNREFISAIRELVDAGIVIGACSNQAEAYKLKDQLNESKVNLEFARDAFSRYAVEGYTVLTF
ncbi:DsrE family protein [Cuniculiplasma sp. SKW4]|uniref:DsrE family protein n=1 Tax=Cuniculiplasma sp. SKW4 TaxID=3400171 RepID=UPI003FD291E9